MKQYTWSKASVMLSVFSDRVVWPRHAENFKLQIFSCQTCCHDTFQKNSWYLMAIFLWVTEFMRSSVDTTRTWQNLFTLRYTNLFIDSSVPKHNKDVMEVGCCVAVVIGLTIPLTNTVPLFLCIICIINPFGTYGKPFLTLVTIGCTSARRMRADCSNANAITLP